jgi:hypothetical protein
MNISMLDRYLTAIVSMPESSRRVNYGGADQEPAPDDGFMFESAKEGAADDRVHTPAHHRDYRIIAGFERPRPQPTFLKRRTQEGVAQSVIADVSCVGYLRARNSSIDACSRALPSWTAI